MGKPAGSRGASGWERLFFFALGVIVGVSFCTITLTYFLTSKSLLNARQSSAELATAPAVRAANKWKPLTSTALTRAPRFTITGRFIPGQLPLIREIFGRRGWREKETSSNVQERDRFLDSDFVWARGDAFDCKQYSLLRPHQKVNHCPGLFQVGNKDNLAANLQKFAAEFGPEAMDFHPRTYVLMRDFDEAAAALDRADGSVFMLKPALGARAEGLKIVTKRSELPRLDRYVLQEYIRDPLLVDGRKFTLRVYVAPTSFAPLRVYVYNDGFVHFSADRYSEDPESLGNRFVHITNPDLSNQRDEFKKEQSSGASSKYWTHKEMWAHLDANGYSSEDIRAQMHSIVARTFVMASDRFNADIGECVPKWNNCFDFFGLDFLVQASGKVWLIEINHTPSTDAEYRVAHVVKTRVVDDLLRLADVFPDDADAGRDEMRRRVESFLRQFGGGSKKDCPESGLTESMLLRGLELRPECLTEGDVDVIVDTELENQRRGGWVAAMPLADPSLLPFFRSHKRPQALASAWLRLRDASPLPRTASGGRAVDFALDPAPAVADRASRGGGEGSGAGDESGSAGTGKDKGPAARQRRSATTKQRQGKEGTRRPPRQSRSQS